MEAFNFLFKTEQLTDRRTPSGKIHKCGQNITWLGLLADVVTAAESLHPGLKAQEGELFIFFIVPFCLGSPRVSRHIPVWATRRPFNKAEFTGYNRRDCVHLPTLGCTLHKPQAFHLFISFFLGAAEPPHITFRLRLTRSHEGGEDLAESDGESFSGEMRPKCISTAREAWRRLHHADAPGRLLKEEGGWNEVWGERDLMEVTRNLWKVCFCDRRWPLEQSLGFRNCL